jgi:hypothetical protein
MPDLRVAQYALTWRWDANQGAVLLIFENGDNETIKVDSAGELAALAAILNESSVGYRTETKALFTGKQPIGGT